MNLTTSKEHYLKTIYSLSDDNQGVHITEIAEKLEISKASVCTAMKALQEGNYIYRGKKRLVYLTKKGEMQARSLTEKFETIQCFLMRILHIDSEIAAQDACVMEHVVSTETLHAMLSLTNQH